MSEVDPAYWELCEKVIQEARDMGILSVSGGHLYDVKENTENGKWKGYTVSVKPANGEFKELAKMDHVTFKEDPNRQLDKINADGSDKLDLLD